MGYRTDDVWSRETLRRAGVVIGYGVLGAATTAVVAFIVLNLAKPLQHVVYDLFYLQVGPSEATETAILTHFLVAGFTAISAVLLAGDYLSDRLAHRAAIARGVGVLLLLLVLFLVVSVAGLAAFLTAILVLAAAAVAVPVLLWYRYEMRSGGIPAFVGGIPILVLLLLVAGFGLGWGWGYMVTAEEVPASTVDGAAAADFDGVPQVRDDLFGAGRGDCSTGTDGRRVCRLYLRGYEHEVWAARFMARHGVRCQYQHVRTGRSDSFVARYNGSYYRVSCSPHGD